MEFTPDPCTQFPQPLVDSGLESEVGQPAVLVRLLVTVKPKEDNDFDGEGLTGQDVGGDVDLAECALAQPFYQSILPVYKQFTRQPLHLNLIYPEDYVIVGVLQIVYQA